MVPKRIGCNITADIQGSGANLELLVLYHNKPNRVKQVIAERKKSGLPASAKRVVDRVMMDDAVVCGETMS